ncbi:MAG: rod-binding protein [Hyphomonadaceae bacterium]
MTATGPLPLQGAPLGLQPSTPREVPAEIRRIAEDFESVFLAEMLGPMFDGLQTDGLGGGGTGEEIFRPMLIERYAEAISHAGGVGIADSIVRELMRMQEMVVLEEPADGAAG